MNWWSIFGKNIIPCLTSWATLMDIEDDFGHANKVTPLHFAISWFHLIRIGNSKNCNNWKNNVNHFYYSLIYSSFYLFVPIIDFLNSSGNKIQYQILIKIGVSPLFPLLQLLCRKTFSGSISIFYWIDVCLQLQ